MYAWVAQHLQPKTKIFSNSRSETPDSAHSSLARLLPEPLLMTRPILHECQHANEISMFVRNSQLSSIMHGLAGKKNYLKKVEGLVHAGLLEAAGTAGFLPDIR